MIHSHICIPTSRIPLALVSLTTAISSYLFIQSIKVATIIWQLKFVCIMQAFMSSIQAEFNTSIPQKVMSCEPFTRLFISS